MTTFFIPDTPPGEQTSRVYEELRVHAELATGRAARSRRIFKLSCRHGGADCETSVGTNVLAGTDIVDAIFDIGDGYVILWDGGHEILSKRQTYFATEFE